jgi:FG-GAP repeat
VYVFQRRGSSWHQTAKLTQPGGGAFESFGGSVAVEGQTLIVGAPAASQGDAASVGAAYIFTRRSDSWTLQTELMAGDLEPTAAFGFAVGISQHTALIGAPSALNSSGAATGAAYVFERSGESWTQRVKLTAADGMNFDFFGSRLAIKGSTAVIGAEEHPTNAGSFAGSAYIFQREKGFWKRSVELIASDGTTGAKFGCSVALDQKTLLVGAGPQTTGAGVSAGEAYVFQLDDRE